MNTLKYLPILILLILSISCTEEFDLDLPEQEPKLIVDAMITDGEPPYFVRLTLSKNAFDKIYEYHDTAGYFINNQFSPTLDAQIIISDNAGNTDTLITDYTESYDYIYNPETQSWDSTFYVNNERGQKGYYRTQNLQGNANNTYTILIKWQGKEYTSTCTMPVCPKIDSVTYEYTIGEEGKSDYYVPHIWFKDNPNTRDYYLFKTYGGGGVWSRSILSDEFIDNEVAGLNVFQGESHDWWRNGYPMPGNYYRIEMYAITKEIYEYYEALIAQFCSDGGIYTPTPTSPPTSISGYSQGYFSTSGFQYVEDIMPYEENIGNEGNTNNKK